MKVLHTSDWHIGKRLMGRTRLDEQAQVLNEIADICDNEKVELVIVAGDVFDTYLPSAESEDLFFKVATRLSQNGRAVLFISGNHDDNVRLMASSPLSEKSGIYIIGNAVQIPSINLERRIKAVETGECHIIFENEIGEKVYVNALPFPNEARFNEIKIEGETYADKMSRWIAIGEEDFKKDIPYIFVSHLFVAGGQVSESERNIDVGGERAVPVSLLPDADYIALGHLHKRQEFQKKNAVYTGSILQYAFDEANTKKSITVFDIDKNGVSNKKDIDLKSGKQLVRLECNTVGEGIELLKKYENDYFIELSLNLKEPLTATETKTLKETNENLISLRTNILNQVFGMEMKNKKHLSGRELFTEYYKSLYQDNPPDELFKLYIELSEAEDET